MKEQVAPVRRSRRTQLRRHLTAWAALAVPAIGCVIDTDDLCGPNQVSWGDDERCVCAEGTGYTPQGCVPCGENEVSSPAGCVCRQGYARPSAGQACAEVLIGAPCSGDSECANPNFPTCQASEFGGYCTVTGCTSNNDCTSGFTCDTSASPSYCRRPPVGVGTPCTGPEDCADTEATFCDLVISQTCIVEGCDAVTNPCWDPALVCCAVPNIANICIPQGTCLS